MSFSCIDPASICVMSQPGGAAAYVCQSMNLKPVAEPLEPLRKRLSARRSPWARVKGRLSRVLWNSAIRASPWAFQSASIFFMSSFG